MYTDTFVFLEMREQSRIYQVYNYIRNIDDSILDGSGIGKRGECAGRSICPREADVFFIHQTLIKTGSDA